MLWGISYANLNMLLATIPVFEPDDDNKEKKKAGKKVTSLADVFKEE